ncbi:hypothetical protein GTN27_04260 [Ochrobactrum sp. EEELCW01]|nr:hypothetical protein GTN27_04260 [Ochrobactrum sp. EEELCW01]
MDHSNLGHEFEHPLGVFRGMNPAFVQKVWAKRRAEEKRKREQEARAQLKELRKQEARERAERAARQLEAARKNELVKVRTANRPLVVDIIAAVAHDFGVSAKDVMSRDRRYNVVKARHAAMAEVAKLRLDLSTVKIGELFGGRDHSTVVHAIQKHGINREALKSAHKQAA